MIPFEKCPLCNGETESRKVEKLVRGGKHTAVLEVEAEVCTHCGEKLFAKETILLFEKIREKLQKQEFSNLEPLGQNFRIAG